MGSRVASQGHAAGADVGAARGAVVDGSLYRQRGRTEGGSGWRSGEAEMTGRRDNGGGRWREVEDFVWREFGLRCGAVWVFGTAVSAVRGRADGSSQGFGQLSLNGNNFSLRTGERGAMWTSPHE